MRSADSAPERQRQASLSRRIATFAVWWAVLFGVWLVLVDSLAHPEVAGGVIAAIPAALIALGVSNASSGRFRVRLRWLGALRGVPLSILRDTGILALALWRRLAHGEQPPSSFRSISTPMSGEDAEAAGRRALAIAGTSVAPNTFVVGIDRERGAALVHQLLPQPPEQLRRAVVGAALSESAFGGEE